MPQYVYPPSRISPVPAAVLDKVCTSLINPTIPYRRDLHGPCRIAISLSFLLLIVSDQCTALLGLQLKIGAISSLAWFSAASLEY